MQCRTANKDHRQSNQLTARLRFRIHRILPPVLQIPDLRGKDPTDKHQLPEDRAQQHQPFGSPVERACNEALFVTGHYAQHDRSVLSLCRY